MIGKGLIFLGSILLLTRSVFGQQKITVSGYVSEKGTGEPIIGATILIKGLQGVGTVTDINGNYTLGKREKGDRCRHGRGFQVNG